MKTPRDAAIERLQNSLSDWEGYNSYIGRDKIVEQGDAMAAAIRLILDALQPSEVRFGVGREVQVTTAMERAALESVAVDDEGPFPCLLDLLDFSGENKAHTVIRTALVAALQFAPSPPPEGWRPTSDHPDDGERCLVLLNPDRFGTPEQIDRWDGFVGIFEENGDQVVGWVRFPRPAAPPQPKGEGS